jgi:hypothetical protein
VPVPASYEHQLTRIAAVDELPRLLQCRMVSMIEPDTNEAAAPMSGINNRVDLGDGSGCRLFDEHVLAAVKRRARDVREHVRARRGDHKIDVRMIEHRFQVPGRQGIRRRRGQRLGARELQVGARNEPRSA